MAFTKSTAVAIIVLSLVIIAISLFALPSLQTDTRPNAFLAADNPALSYREKVREVFGLSDPLIIALQDNGPRGIFTPTSLALLKSLSDEISQLSNIDDARVVSLATGKNIAATQDGMQVSDFLEPLPETQAEADAIRAAVFDFPLYLGNLVSADGKIALIVAELIDEDEVESTYEQVQAIADRVSATGVVKAYVAGEGAIAGYLAKYIDIDARRLNPLAWAIIMLILYLAFRQFSPPLMANLIIAASVLIPLGIMAAVGIPFYMITSALPVILIGISVADTIHIYSHYFELQTKDPTAEIEDLIATTMRDMWRLYTKRITDRCSGCLCPVTRSNHLQYIPELRN